MENRLTINLDEMGISFENLWYNQGDDHFELVADDVEDTDEYWLLHRVVFKEKSTGNYYSESFWYSPSTGDAEFPTELTQVFPKEKTIVVYE